MIFFVCQNTHVTSKSGGISATDVEGALKL